MKIVVELLQRDNKMVPLPKSGTLNLQKNKVPTHCFVTAKIDHDTKRLSTLHEKRAHLPVTIVASSLTRFEARALARAACLLLFRRARKIVQGKEEVLSLKEEDREEFFICSEARASLQKICTDLLQVKRPSLFHLSYR